MRYFILWGLWIALNSQTFAESSSQNLPMDSSSHRLKRDTLNPKDKDIKLKVPHFSDYSLKKERDKSNQSEALRVNQNYPWKKEVAYGQSKGQWANSSKDSYDFNQDRLKRSQEIHDHPYKKFKASDPSMAKTYISKKYKTSRKMKF